MKISELYVYPIKSLRGFPLQEAELLEQGIKGDREFMLLRDYEDGKAPKGGRYEVLQVSHYAQMVLFQTSYTQKDGEEVIEVVHRDPENSDITTVHVPRYPNVDGLEPFETNLHLSPVTAYNMGDELNQWFSDRFKFKTVFVYIGTRRRTVYGNLAPNAAERNARKQQRLNSSPKSWVSSMTTSISSLLTSAPSDTSDSDDDYGLTFSDVSPYLIITRESVADVSARLTTLPAMDQRKFRPNIVLEGAEGAFVEDYWRTLLVHSAAPIKLDLTNNCVRCNSLNVDFDTGKNGEGEVGQVLKKLQADRRVDKGTKYNPVFGRYGFVDRASLAAGDCTVQVGDEVEVSARNDKRTQIKWPGLAGPKDELWPV